MLVQRDLIPCLVQCATLFSIRRHTGDTGRLPDGLDAKEVHRLCVSCAQSSSLATVRCQSHAALDLRVSQAKHSRAACFEGLQNP
jgi:hypothetical protein